MNKGRIIGGKFKRRIIKTPKCQSTRPTSDIVKEIIFNVLIHRFHIGFSTAGVMDIFAGSGALGIEAISLGCSNVLFVDNNLESIKCIKDNLTALNISGIARVLQKNASCLPKDLLDTIFKKEESLVIFMDPPYSDKELLVSTIEILKACVSVQENALFVIETDEDLNIPFLEIVHKKQHGGTFVLFGKLL